MCGLVGISSKWVLGSTHKAFFYHALLMDTLRGTHGTGVVAIDKEDTAFVAKRRGVMFDLFREKGWDTMYKDGWDKSRALMGHNRHATKGEHTDVNAHPFTHSHITMMHNGTLDSGVDMTKHTVDSDGLCKLIADKGPLDAFAEVFGAYACVWWDSKTNTINFIKNSQRPLTIVEYMSEIYWASEADMLYYAMSRSLNHFDKARVVEYDIVNDTWYQIDENHDLVIMGKVTKKSYPTKTYTSPSYPHTGKNYTYHKNKDLYANFLFYDRYPSIDYQNQKSWIYVGESDRAEKVFMKTTKDIADWDNCLFNGELVRGMQYNVYPQQIISEGAYQIVASTLEIVLGSGGEVRKIEKKSVIDEEPTVKTIKVPNLKQESVPLSKMERLIGRGCACCGTKIEIEEVGQCVPVLNDTGDILSMICPFCSEEIVESYLYDQENIRLSVSKGLTDSTIAKASTASKGSESTEQQVQAQC